jgi:hypothetical protein
VARTRDLAGVGYCLCSLRCDDAEWSLCLLSESCSVAMLSGACAC